MLSPSYAPKTLHFVLPSFFQCYFSRWPFRDEDVAAINPLISDQHLKQNRTEDIALHGYIMK